MLDRLAVIQAYRFLLGRDPESEAAVEEKLAAHQSWESLRQDMMSSPEFLERAAELPLAAPSGPRMGKLDTGASQGELADLLAKARRAWGELGRSEPYWSAVTSERYRMSQIERSRDDFYDSGEASVARMQEAMQRVGEDERRFAHALEYGCGAGRVTRALARISDRVTACDISEGHLRQAREWVGSEGVRFSLIESLDWFEERPGFDLLFSIMVLQHNPPPLVRFALRRLLEALRPGGLAYFQLPTYRRGYSFDLDAYLKSDDRSEIEMHCLPQSEVFATLRETGCAVLEVSQDSYASRRQGQVSNTFLARKLEG